MWAFRLDPVLGGNSSVSGFSCPGNNVSILIVNVAYRGTSSRYKEAVHNADRHYPCQGEGVSEGEITPFTCCGFSGTDFINRGE